MLVKRNALNFSISDFRSLARTPFDRMAEGGAARLLESLPSEFDFFESNVIQSAIVNEFDHPFGPVGTFQPGAPIEISIPPTSNCYRDLNSSRLEIKCKITNADGSNIAADANVGVVNLAAHSLFSNIEMDIGNKRISDPNNFYPYRAFFETLLSYNEDVLKTRLQIEGWRKDTEGQFNTLSLADAAANTGYKERSRRFATSGVVCFQARPHLDLFHQDKDIPPGVRILLRLIPSPVPFVVKKAAAGGEQYTIKIMSIKLWVRCKEVSPSLLLAHQSMLQQHNIRIPYTKVALKHLTIPIGVTAIEFDNIYTGVLPDRLMLAFLRDTNMNAGYTANPFVFEHLNISYIVLRLNGEQIPRTPYQPDFDRIDYIREYLGLLEGLNIDTSNKAIDLTPTEWANSYPFFMFRSAPSGLPSLPRTGAARLELQFRAPTAHIYNVLCYAEFPAMIEIDQYDNVVG